MPEVVIRREINHQPYNIKAKVLGPYDGEEMPFFKLEIIRAGDLICGYCGSSATRPTPPVLRTLVGQAYLEGYGIELDKEAYKKIEIAVEVQAERNLLLARLLVTCGYPKNAIAFPEYIPPVRDDSDPKAASQPESRDDESTFGFLPSDPDGW